MPALFAATIFVSAMLLFMVQPMVGKRILPLLGGSPAAWNTCMVFFQMLLLLGYLYSHTVTARLPARPQTLLHRSVLGLALAWLLGMSVLSPDHSPVAVFRSLAPTGESYPILGVLVLLTVAIALPFLVVSTSAPLLQKWFTFTGHPSAKDPYFLYAASNAGSLISLLAYPILIEPRLTLSEQAWLWTGGFALLLVLVVLCASAANNPLRPPPVKPIAGVVAAPSGPSPSWADRLRWVGYAFVPSSLMLGVTFHMTTDIASDPLLWVIPLALYLLTFIIAFAKLPAWFRPLIGNLSPVLTLLLVFVLTSGAMGEFKFYSLGIHLLVYFFTALLMHSELALARPAPAHLTEYFLWISVGGVLGGIFNALIAPMVFTSDYEYPLAIALGCALVPVLTESKAVPSRLNRRVSLALDFVAPLLLGGLMVGVFAVASKTTWFYPAVTWCSETVTAIAGRLNSGYVMPTRTLVLLPLYALPCMLCFFAIDRPLRFGLCVAAVLGVNLYRDHQASDAEHSVRSYFGIMKVEKYTEPYSAFRFLPDDPETKPDANWKWHESKSGNVRGYMYEQPMRKLLHGTTLHGVQAAGPWGIPVRDDLQALAVGNPWGALALVGMQTAFDSTQEPLTYYHRTGPVGAIVRRFRQVEPLGHIGMVGLGTGSVSCYALPGQKLTYYEIDRHVVEMMEAGTYFTYLNDAKKRGAIVNVVLGDARLQLEPTADRYGLLLIDAFSSDSIPIHLLTKQSLELYKSRLTDHGLLALHISNRYIDLEPVVARLADETGLKCRVFSDEDDDASGKTRSSWVLLAKTDADLGADITGEAAKELYGAVSGGLGHLILDNPSYPTGKLPWRELPILPAVKTWTDDYSDVMAVIRMPEVRWLRRKFGLPVPSDSGQ